METEKQVISEEQQDIGNLESIGQVNNKRLEEWKNRKSINSNVNTNNSSSSSTYYEKNNSSNNSKQLQKKNIVIYGISTEGYGIAKKILRNQSEVTIIDENSKLGIVLNQDIVREYQNISFLMEEELLLNLEPFEKSISNAPIIFFAPRIRKINHDVNGDIISKFKEILGHLKKGTSIVFNIPLGIGGNTEIVSLIEHLSGYSVGTDIFYYYNPISKIELNQTIIGSFQLDKSDTYFINIMKSIYGSADREFPRIIDIHASEIMYSINTVSHYSSMASTNEIMKQNKPRGDKADSLQKHIKGIFFDELVNGLFDLRMINLSIASSSPLGHIINGTIKSIEGFIKNLVEETRAQMKKREIKASRTKATIFWNIDNNEIRGDKSIMRELLESKLRDYIAEVEIQSIDNFLPDTITNVMIVCSLEDYSKILLKLDKEQQHHNAKMVIVCANTFFNVIEA
ncbi:MAG: hypothetical protein M3162_07040 [Thermoproteota archaeon]|nr:hypothetical protein [Thermoproteota archaeon]